MKGWVVLQGKPITTGYGAGFNYVEHQEIVMKNYLYHRICPTVAVLLSLLGFSGCVHYQGEGAVGTIIATSEAFKSFDGEYENTLFFKDHKPDAIAVLPFSSSEEKLFTAEDRIGSPEDIVRKGLYNHISSLPFKDLEIFTTDNRLLNAGVQSSKALDRLVAENPGKLKSILGVDAAITGRVTHFDKIFAGLYSQVAVGCEVKMWDLETGHLLWRAKHVSRAHAGGISLNPVGLLLSAVASAWNLRDTELLSQTDELFREIVSTIELPPSMQKTVKSKVAIDLFAVMNAEKPFTAGKDISFRLIGDPGCSAYVDLGDYKNAIDLSPLPPLEKERMKSEIMASLQRRQEATAQQLSREMRADLEKGFAAREIYEGVYTVSPGEERYALTAKAFLVNAFGDQAFKLDLVHRIDIDAKPPAAVANLSFESLDRKVRLQWPANTEMDLAGYEIWTSTSPLSGFAFLKTSEKADVYLEDLVNFERLYVRIRATDRADNKGAFSAVVEAVPLPEQGLYDLPQPGPVLDGAISGSILLVRGKSPYHVPSEITIKAGARLVAAPGVEIRFSPNAALVVAGGSFMAYGRKDLPVRLLPSAFQAQPGAWRGLILDHASHTVLNHIAIEKAQNGITIVNSSPEIFGATIQSCSQAGFFLRENAKPNITCSELISNQGQGAMVIEGAGIAPMVHNNTFIGNTPFQIQSYTPLEVDVTNNFWGRPVPDETMFLGRIVWDPFLTAPPETCSQR